jgi:DnaJ like chaperone protein
VPEAYAGLTVAEIALCAKMAKADSIATRKEVTTFCCAFNSPPEEETNAARVFNLARRNVTGFDADARKIRNMFGAGDRRHVFIDLIKGLFHAALAGATLHAAEDGFRHQVADIFGLDTRC